MNIFFEYIKIIKFKPIFVNFYKIYFIILNDLKKYIISFFLFKNVNFLYNLYFHFINYNKLIYYKLIF